MAEPRQLSKAPLREALIDFRVSLPETFDVKKFMTLDERLKEEYPHVQQQIIVEGQLQIRPGGNVVAQDAVENLRGYILRSKDESKVAQFRIDGFTFSKLPPYTDWDDVFPEAYRLWRMYCDVSGAEYATRLAVRYINSIQLPLPVKELGDYFTAAPTIPPELPQNMTHFLSRATIMEQESGISASLVQALESVPQEGRYATILLDIDVYKAGDARASDGDKLKSVFSDLRTMKNKIFFSSITEKTVRLLQ